MTASAFFHVHRQPDLAGAALPAVWTRNVEFARLVMLCQLGQAGQDALAAFTSEVVLPMMLLQDVCIRGIEITAGF
jgi:hypothetical protein